jgi:hypothetical protein
VVFLVVERMSRMEIVDRDESPEGEGATGPTPRSGDWIDWSQAPRCTETGGPPSPFCGSGLHGSCVAAAGSLLIRKKEHPDQRLPILLPNIPYTYSQLAARFNRFCDKEEKKGQNNSLERPDRKSCCLSKLWPICCCNQSV